MNGNVTVTHGDYITQASSGANLRVIAETTSGANVTAVYIVGSISTLDLTGNISINGVTQPVRPQVVGYSSNMIDALLLNGSVMATAIYPVSIAPIGEVATDPITLYGNVTITSNTTLRTANVWYNLGTGVATDGTGFEGSTTIPVLFLKEATATNTVINIIPDELGTEDAINTLTTESGSTIIEE
jgi:hypothetical protein